MKSRHLTLLFSAVFLSVGISPGLQAYEEDWALKMGPSITSTIIHTLETHSRVTPGLGFHSHMVYKWAKWEAGLSSYVGINPLNRARLEARGSKVEGSFHYRSVSFGPTFRRNFPFSPIGPKWFTYALTGPLVAQQSFKTDSVHVQGGQYESHQKITLESYGFILAMGIEEEAKNKHFNFYYEISYKYLTGRRIQTVGGTHTAVETLSHEKQRERITEHTMNFSLGFIVF